ncbi:MAG: glucosamine-6-phosphate deaminase [Thermoanaerobaculia bacterium]
MKVVRLAHPEAVARAAADLLAGAAAASPELTLGLPTGRTPLPFYAELAERRRRGGLDLSRVRALNLDELVLPRGHPATFRVYMERHVWGPLGLDPKRRDIPNGATTDLVWECRRYDWVLAEAGGFDLAFLGIGADGHVAYNLPGPPVDGTHVVPLPGNLAEALGVPAAWTPLRAITVGMASLRAARRLVLLATGAAKRQAMRALLEEPAGPRWPISLLRDHPDFQVLVSEDALGSEGRPS